MKEKSLVRFEQEGPFTGWLLVYCLSRGLVEPLYLVLTVNKLSGTYLKAVELGFATAGLAAVFLIYKRSVTAFRFIGSDLILRSCFSLLIFATILRNPPRNNHTPIVHFVSALLIAGVQWVFIIAWLLYFKTANRVRANFGKTMLSSD